MVQQRQQHCNPTTQQQQKKLELRLRVLRMLLPLRLLQAPILLPQLAPGPPPPSHHTSLPLPLQHLLGAAARSVHPLRHPLVVVLQALEPPFLPPQSCPPLRLQW
jgi:hypothetical protein